MRLTMPFTASSAPPLLQPIASFASAPTLQTLPYSTLAYSSPSLPATLLHTTAISNRSPLTSITPRFLAQLCLADPALAPLSDLLARCFAITMDHLARLAANMVASADRLLDGAACKLEDPGLPDWRR